MPTRAIMIQGTGSNVGKSMLVAGLCRAATRRGLSVAPFKPQNMSNNAAVTEDGGEIGRAQALQAMACGRPLSVHMNPILLKPETDSGSQVIVQGQRHSTLQARDFSKARAGLMTPVLESFGILGQSADLIIVEGAGSPAEVNLRQNDLANMGFARAAGVPVVLAGDINRGGVIAQIVGTQVVMDPQDAAMITGFLVNKFRGDVSLFDDGYREIERRTGWTGFGTLPWFANAHLLPAEDAVDLSRAPSDGGFHIVCPMLSRISNFDDLDPLAAEASVRLTMVPPGTPLPADADLVILPGTKSTRGDLAFLRAQGWDIDLYAHVRRGGAVLGICGGYQMLGRFIEDPQGFEGPAGREEGLGLLDVETRMAPDKTLTRVTADHAATGTQIDGYEIHIGQTVGADCAMPFAHINGTPDGAGSRDGKITGTYLHGLFTNDSFRSAWLAQLGLGAGPTSYSQTVEDTLDALADHMETHLDVSALLARAAPVA
ncbi:cobyric acid synthase [Sulfitobacter sp. TMED3]|uniref:cobyric acid synthase n=1 Tax=Sulfitobacter sp. TMED3 TaxID=1986591 RepID=UPI000B6CD82D|nr:cobyric acid synthase [Sulfitobacter sp. TMED3]MAJ77183.1 cobyric acid synthase CobQ [Roseobacter sp.]OUT38087.1 MAG: cobyric acid synthase CobQ [Sulfitobacter sp. TMED3]